MDDDLYIDFEKIVNHLIITSEEDYRTMISLYNSKSYNWSLFLGHICIKKILKAKFIMVHKKHAPFTHNLFRLAELSSIELTEEQADCLDRITTFNLNARYDDYKREFYFQCTPEYTKDWIQKIKTTYTWIKQML
jgi:HEPN domain-containing protein